MILVVLALSGPAVSFATSLWTTLEAPDTTTSNLFGHSVATSSSWIVVGAPFDSDAGYHAGAFYLWEHRAPQGWLYRGKSTISGSTMLGWSVDTDDDNVVVGGRGDLVYVYETSAFFPYLSLVGTLGPGDPDNVTEFGRSVAIDGDTIVVGAHDRNQGSELSVGAVYLFQRTGGGVWPGTENLILTAEDGTAADWFGYSVAIDDDLVVVGAPYSDECGIYAGEAYAFANTPQGWQQTREFHSSDSRQYDLFGSSVAVDGTTVVVGAPYQDMDGALHGRAHIFEAGFLGWEDHGWVDGSRADGPGDDFGIVVALGSNGDVMLVGAKGYGPTEIQAGTGMTHLFETSATMGLLESARLSQPPEPRVGALFGQSVDLEGTTLVVASRWPSAGDGGNGCDDCGVVYVYSGFSLIFADGFDSGNSSAWSLTQP